MTNNHKTRIEKLEAERTPGKCSCGKGCRVVYPEGYRLAGGIAPSEPGPVVCPTCGGERVTVEVTYTSFAYDGKRQPLATDDTGQVVFDYDAAIAAICDDDESGVR